MASVLIRREIRHKWLKTEKDINIQQREVDHVQIMEGSIRIKQPCQRLGVRLLGFRIVRKQISIV